MKKLLLFTCIFLINATGFSQTSTDYCLKRFSTDVSSYKNTISILGERTCIIPNLVQDPTIDMEIVNKFLKLEKEIGEPTYDVHHVSQLKVFSLSYGHTFFKKYIDFKKLESLVYFSADQLGIYEKEDIFPWYFDQLDVFRNSEVLNVQELRTWLAGKFIDAQELLKDDYYNAEDIALVTKEILARERIYDQALDELVKIAFFGEEETITIYPLLDNNNENVADAQWVIVGRHHLILLNKYWWL